MSVEIGNSAHSNPKAAPVMAIAEKAADLIKEDLRVL
jgi:hypothetical protein